MKVILIVDGGRLVGPETYFRYYKMQGQSTNTLLRNDKLSVLGHDQNPSGTVKRVGSSYIVLGVRTHVRRFGIISVT